MFYYSNCKYTLSLCRAIYRQAVKASSTTILVTLDHMIRVVQDSREAADLTRRGGRKV